MLKYSKLSWIVGWGDIQGGIATLLESNLLIFDPIDLTFFIPYGETLNLHLAFIFWSQTFKMNRILFCLVIGFFTLSKKILVKNLAKLNHILWDSGRLMDIFWDLAKINDFHATIKNKNKIQFILFILNTFHAEYQARIKCLVGPNY